MCVRVSLTLWEILVAIVFGLENLTFLVAKSDIWIPKCTVVRGGSKSLGNIPKKY